MCLTYYAVRKLCQMVKKICILITFYDHSFETSEVAFSGIS